MAGVPDRRPHAVHTLTRRFVADRHCIAAARRATEELNGRVTRRARDDLSLLVSELVTNAVIHGSRRSTDSIAIILEAWDAWVRATVSDDGDGFSPAAAAGGAGDRPGGLGLVLVDRVAEHWGVRGSRPTEVWFELSNA